MGVDYVYENAPLIEVIAEIHWALKKLETSPDAKIDPYYDLFEKEFLKFLRNLDLVKVQELIPASVPLEILPNQPRLRIWRELGQWPVAQVGPGVITANIVPPYNGWKEFEPFLDNLIDGLFSSYPIADKTLRIEKLHLRYIDGFDDRFEFKQYSQFADEMLGIPMPLSNDFAKSFIKKGSEVTYLLENRFQNTTPEGSIGKIKLAPGKVNNKNSLIMEMHCESSFPINSSITADAVTKWFAQAHRCLHAQFEKLITSRLKTIFGKKREIST